jgi:hypothetical protein
MKTNFLILALAALIPLIVGFIWYNKIAFGKAWIKSAGLTEESVKGGNMPLIFGLVYLFSFFIAIAVNFMVIHHFHLFSIVMGDPSLQDPNSELSLTLKKFMERYGNNYRTFKHGAFHGTIGGVFFALPVIAIGALFEKRGFTYIAIHAGYWIVSLLLMGGTICALS